MKLLPQLSLVSLLGLNSLLCFATVAMFANETKAGPLPLQPEEAFYIEAFGNSQIGYCGGSLTPFEAMLKEAGYENGQVAQTTGSAYFLAHVSKVTEGRFTPKAPTHITLFTQQEARWDEFGLTANIAALQQIHKAVTGAEGITGLFMTYLIGNEPAGPETIAKFDQYWQDAKTAAEQVLIDGEQHEILLVPVMHLWERGKQAYPKSTSGPIADPCDDGWMHDPLHGGYKAQFATATLFYAYLTCNDPRNLSYSGNVDPSFSNWAKQAAWELLQTTYTPRFCFRSTNPLPPPAPLLDFPFSFRY